MAKIYSVIQINSYIKNMMDTDFLLGNLNISGEISNCKYHSSGHIYFTLKDKDSTISAVMFAGNRAKGLDFRLEEGLQVVVSGRISVYEQSGKYQIYAATIKKAGNGELYEKFLALKKELREMGMFDEMYKKPIPKNIKRLGIVTASTGAALHDIITVSRRRNPGIEIVLFPAKVQGEGAAESVGRGIRALDAFGVDVIIAGRGGGSIEDLWAFNDEELARTVFECNTPVISAVGHEVDYTIMDFVADLRAETPSAAAEQAVVDINEVKYSMEELRHRMNSILELRIFDLKNLLASYNTKLKYLSPQNVLGNRRIMLDDMYDRVNLLMNSILQRYRSEFKLLCTRINGASPLAKLVSGFSYTEDEKGNNITSIHDIEEDAILKIHVTDGYILTQVKEKKGRD